MQEGLQTCEGWAYWAEGVECLCFWGWNLHTWPTVIARCWLEALFVFSVSVCGSPCQAAYHNTTIVFGAGGPERSLLSSCLVKQTSRLDEGKGWPFISLQLCLKRNWRTFPYATGSLGSGAVISTHRNTYLREGNNGKGYFKWWGLLLLCSRGVGELLNQPHAEFFPLNHQALTALCQLDGRGEACVF